MQIRKYYEIAGPVYYAHKGLAAGSTPQQWEAHLTVAQDISDPIKFLDNGIQYEARFMPAKHLMVIVNFPDDPVLEKYLIDPAVAENATYEQLIRDIDTAARKVMGMVKYIFGYEIIEEYGVIMRDTEVWQNPSWVKCVSRIKYKWVPGETMIALLKGEIDTIVSLFNDNIKPLHGMKFLSKAKRETNLRDRCLFLATAAELSIKEYFQRVGYTLPPKVPFQQLYSVYLGRQSGAPFVDASKIGDNSLLRNKIVHELDEDPVITPEQSIEYMDAVEKGILHLMTLLYPKNQTLKDLLNEVDNSL